MNFQIVEKAGKWLFGVVLAGGIVFSTNGVEFLPFIAGIVFLAALPGFPDFRRQIHWRRVFLLGTIAMLVPLGMYYWGCLNNSDDPVADFCYWAIWPLVDEDTNGDAPLAYWLPFWVMKGLLFGFIIESLSALSKQRGVKRVGACVRRNSEEEGDVPPFGLAGIFCMVCMTAICLAARSLAGLNPRLDEWLLPTLFIIGPTTAPFVILYCSSWQREMPATRRMIAIVLRSSAIFGVVLFIVLMMSLAILLLFWASQDVPRAQYGGL